MRCVIAYNSNPSQLQKLNRLGYRLAWNRLSVRWLSQAIIDHADIDEGRIVSTIDLINDSINDSSEQEMTKLSKKKLAKVR